MSAIKISLIVITGFPIFPLDSLVIFAMIKWPSVIGRSKDG